MLSFRPNFIVEQLQSFMIMLYKGIMSSDSFSGKWWISKFSAFTFIFYSLVFIKRAFTLRHTFIQLFFFLYLNYICVKASCVHTSALTAFQMLLRGCCFFLPCFQISWLKTAQKFPEWFKSNEEEGQGRFVWSFNQATEYSESRHVMWFIKTILAAAGSFSWNWLNSVCMSLKAHPSAPSGGAFILAVPSTFD